MQYLVVHDTTKILLAAPYNGDAVATKHTVIIGEFEVLIESLEELSIDVTALVEAKQSHESPKPINTLEQLDNGEWLKIKYT